MAEVVWRDGELLPAAAATVSAFDHGFTVGDGVFETLRAAHGTAFALRRHLERLRSSASRLGIEVPWTDDELRTAVGLVVAGAPRIARVRLTVTSGVGPLGPSRGDQRATVVVAAAPMHDPDPTVAVCTAPWPRNERSALVGVKATSFAEGVVALEAARARGCSEALFANTRGELCEGAASNVFVVVGGRLCTPALTSGCLPGVTRALLLELVDVAEEVLPIDVLATADEVLLTSTGRGVQPAHRVDDRELRAPGPVATAVAEAYAALVARDMDP